MCIVADSVKDVSNTKIASFHGAYTLDDGKTIIPAQLIVYSANVDSNANMNAFILPVYNPGNDYHNIIPLDFSKMPDFFSNLNNIYNRWFPDQMLKAQSYGARILTNSFDSEPLPVFKVGDYKFSIMPSKLDFNRIDRSQLNVSPTAKTAVDAHSKDYSFIVYQFFQKGQLEVTPFGYLCQPCREHAMVVPTIHGHPHDNVPTVGLGYVPNMFVSYSSDFENMADYDHEIYTIVKNPNQTPIIDKNDVVDMDKLLRGINKDYMGRKIRVYVPKSFIPNKIKINGYNENRNILIKPDGYVFVKDLVFDRT
ncbi:hypothetical protein QJ857_gp0026 [Tupanvirus soda lake]|uniref:Uncharacterized protein n=2 Tax=Tupanvirus TaxID=2094720 RepID=A0A6N1NI77_9VIRU|nr:hypothetical protein QJ857_gp0026 [Tupanvirus soda lake]QKU34675.1 hypothetical protein [Tupanvirus soda lake]